MPGAAKTLWTSADKLIAFELPYWRGALMGKPGGGKSHCAASFPKRMLVLATDPETKLQPYFDQGRVVDAATIGAQGQTIYLVRAKDSDDVIIQIECFYDTDPDMGTSAMTQFATRMGTVVTEVRDGFWRTVVIDSWSSLEDCASDRRLRGPLAIKAGGAFAAHRGAAKEDLRQIFRIQLIHLPCNVVIIFHVTKFQKEEGGESLYSLKAIGDFSTTVGQNLAERYLAEAEPDGMTRHLKTKPDGRYELTTLIDAPSPCQNNYAALWSNYISKRVAEATPKATESTTAASASPAATTGA